MRFQFKIFGKNLVFDYGMKEPDFITAQQVRQYAEKDQLTPKLRSVHKKLTYMSKRHNKTEIFEKDLTQSEIALLERAGFRLRLRTKSVKGQTFVMQDHYIISTK